MTTDTKRLRELVPRWGTVGLLDENEGNELRSLILAACEELEEGRRLERAKELLAEWEKLADNARQPHPMIACATLTYEPGHDWCATFEWAERNEKLGCHSVCASGERHSPDPLTAVITASQQTPWKLEE